MTGQTLLWIDETTPLPPTRRALGPASDAPGLLAAGGRVTPERLEEAYRAGVFPWFSPGQPALWWSPDPRMVLPVAEFKLAPSLRKTLRKFLRTPGCEVRFDHDFRRVMLACANTPREGQHGTWIVPELVEAYAAWGAPRAAGAAGAGRLPGGPRTRTHSIETWIGGELVGGLYGVNIGAMFFGESMFSHRTDASKIALAALVGFCRLHGITLIDCQQHTRHLASFGAREIPRAAFEAHLAANLGKPPPAQWSYHHRLWSPLGLEPGSAAAADP